MINPGSRGCGLETSPRKRQSHNPSIVIPSVLARDLGWPNIGRRLEIPRGVPLGMTVLMNVENDFARFAQEVVNPEFPCPASPG